MRIATVSLNINTPDLNYGAMLHGWATQQVLKKWNIDTEIIDFIPRYIEGGNLKYPILTSIKNRRIKGTIKNALLFFSHKQRFDEFERFKQLHIIKTPVQYTESSLAEAKLDWDGIVCESDVVWSPNSMMGSFEKTFFMALPSMAHLKKVAYAVSMANATLSQSQIEQFSALIHHVDAVSCRETYATQFVQQYTSKQVADVLDPTLLLDRSEYEAITAPPLEKEKYVLIYFPLSYNKKLVQAAHRYAKQHHLKVVEISFYLWEKFRHKVYSAAGVEKWISLIKNAESIFTNSLHAVCFSVLFHKDFYAFDRPSGRKTQDLCNKLGLSERYFVNHAFEKKDPIDYDRVDSILEVKKKESLQWLKTALEIE